MSPDVQKRDAWKAIKSKFMRGAKKFAIFGLKGVDKAFNAVDSVILKSDLRNIDEDIKYLKEKSGPGRWKPLQEMKEAREDAAKKINKLTREANRRIQFNEAQLRNVEALPVEKLGTDDLISRLRQGLIKEHEELSQEREAKRPELQKKITEIESELASREKELSEQFRTKLSELEAKKQRRLDYFSQIRKARVLINKLEAQS